MSEIKLRKRKRWPAIAAIVLLLIFTLWPIINTVRMAFLENYSGLKAVAGVQFEFGLGNFIKVLEYKRFIQCLKNTCLLCVLTVPLSTLLALLIAVALNSIKPLQKFLQTIFFLPYVTNSIAIGMVFAAMFNIVGAFYGTENELIVTAGIINNVIEFFGGKPVNWINYGSSYEANMFVMVVYIVWNALPFKILVLLGGLQSINKQYYDAAKVDGTRRIRVFTRYSYGYEYEMTNSWRVDFDYDPTTGEINVYYPPESATSELVIRADGVYAMGTRPGRVIGGDWQRPEPVYGPFDWEIVSGKGELTVGSTTDYYGTEINCAWFEPSEPGTSIIRATTRDGSKSVNFAVVSEAVLAEKLSLSQKNLTLSVGQTGSVEATLTPEPTLAEHAQVKWQSFNPDVATVDENGTITVTVGKAEMTFAPEEVALCRLRVEF